MSNPSDFVIENGVLKIYNGPGGDVVIPEGVTSIGYYAFSGCSALTSVTIPVSVAGIGDGAFHDCISLTSVTIPEGVTSIGEGAFSGCSSLTNLIIPEGVTRIGKGVFNGCSSLMSVTIPASVTEIDRETFSKTALYREDSCWENNVLYIGKHLIKAKKTLSGAYAIKEETLYIVDSAFSDCGSLTSVQIPEGVISIRNEAFSRCGSLTSATIPASVTSIGWKAFSDCGSLTSVTIPDGVTSIGWEAFSHCSSLTSVTIRPGVTSIGEGAFSGCSSLTSIFTNTKLTKDMFGKYTSFSRPLITNDPGMLPANMKPLAAVGFAENPDDPKSERGKAHFKYIKSNAAKLIKEALAHPALLRLLCENKLLTPEAAEAYLAAAQEAGNPENTALLLDYQQNKLTGKEKEKAAQKAEKREEKVMDFIFSAEALEQLQGKAFVVTGALKTFSSRDEFKACLDACGAILSETLNEQTDYLITNTPDSGSAKNKKAEALGVKKLSEADFNRLIGRKQA